MEAAPPSAVEAAPPSAVERVTAVVEMVEAAPPSAVEAAPPSAVERKTAVVEMVEAAEPFARLSVVAEEEEEAEAPVFAWHPGPVQREFVCEVGALTADLTHKAENA